MPKPSNGKENIMIIYLKRICLLKMYFIQKLFATYFKEIIKSKYSENVGNIRPINVCENVQ